MVTQKEIAQHLGVSRRLVGFALSGSGTVSEATRTKIRAAARELGYQPNGIARAMVTGKNPVIGFLSSQPDHEIAGKVLTGALRQAQHHDHFIKVFGLPSPSADSEQGAPQWAAVDGCVDDCLRLRVAGLMAMFVDPKVVEHLRERLRQYQIPLVLVDTFETPVAGIGVLSDDRQGCEEALEHLSALGHRRIAFINGVPEQGLSRERGLHFERIVARRGLEGRVVYGWWNISETEKITRQLLEQAPRPSALLCASDQMAMVAMRTARQMGVAVPDQLSVIGFADFAMAEYADPPLTSVFQPFAEMGGRAVQRLVNHANERETPSFAPALQESLPTRLIVRRSTAICPEMENHRTAQSTDRAPESASGFICALNSR